MRHISDAKLYALAGLRISPLPSTVVVGNPSLEGPVYRGFIRQSSSSSPLVPMGDVVDALMPHLRRGGNPEG